MFGHYAALQLFQSGIISIHPEDQIHNEYHWMSVYALSGRKNHTQPTTGAGR